MKINVAWLTLKSKFVILILTLFQNIKNTMCSLVGICNGSIVYIRREVITSEAVSVKTAHSVTNNFA